MGKMVRRKTTVYIDEDLLTAAKVEAAFSRKHEYEVFEDALRAHLGLKAAVERIWADVEGDELDDDAAAQLVQEELAAVREQRRGSEVPRQT